MSDPVRKPPTSPAEAPPRDHPPDAAQPAGDPRGAVVTPIAASPGVRRERRNRQMGWRSQDVLRTAALVIAMYLGLRLLWFASSLVLATFLAILFGLGVSVIVDRLARFRVPRGVGAGLVVLGFLALLVGVGALMAPTLREQSRELRRSIPEAVDKLERWVEERQDGVLGLVFGGADDAGAAADTASRASVAGAVERAGDGAEQAGGASGAQEPPASLRDRLGGQMSGVTRYLFPFLSSTLTVISGLFLILFLTIFFAANPDIYHRGLMHLFPHHARARAGEVLHETARVLRKWLVTQLIGMAVIGVVTTGVLVAMDVRAAFALGILAGLLEFIPTVGPIISAVPAMAVAFLDSPEKALWVALAYWVIQTLESNILIPWLMQEGIDLPPAVTIIAQALMAMLFGFLGLLVAVPAAAAIMVPIRRLYVEGVVGDDLDEDDDDAP